MAQSKVQINKSQSLKIEGAAYASINERRIRRISVWVMLILLFQGQLGAAWDREWHANVGRDQFWTPPHTLIYTGVAGAGLIALGMVLLATFQHRRHAKGFDDSSTVQVFRFFHAPLGFVISGFGALLALIAAPLDNYWHELYGIDIAMWAPFHMLGITGGLIGTLGMVYVFASEATIERKTQTNIPRFLGLSLLEWGTLAALAAVLNFTLIGFLQFPVINIGLMELPTYLIPMTAAGAFCFVGAVRFTGRPWTATILLFLLLLETLGSELFIPWAIRTAVAQQGLAFRIPGHIPYFRPPYGFLPVFFLFSALLIDSITFWRIKNGKKAESTRYLWLIGMGMSFPEIVVAVLLILFSLDPAYTLMNQVNSYIPPELAWPVFLLSSLVLLFTGALFAVLGADLGDIWHWSTR